MEDASSGIDGGIPLLRIALDAEWERGVNDDTYLPQGSCAVVLIELGADSGRRVPRFDGVGRAGEYALLRDRVDAALRMPSERGSARRNRYDERLHD